MCFSPEASFAGATVLGAIGGASLTQLRSKNQLMLGVLPLLFSLQQFSEGLLWLSLRGEDPLMGQISMYLFLFFALILWPIWIPLSIYVIEEQPLRKKVIGGCLLAGAALAIVNLTAGIQGGAEVKIVGHSLHYLGKVPSQNYIYMAIVLVPCFVSSFTGLWQFGLILGITALIADYFYANIFLSVWCFSAAICSLSLFKIFRQQRAVE